MLCWSCLKSSPLHASPFAALWPGLNARNRHTRAALRVMSSLERQGYQPHATKKSHSSALCVIPERRTWTQLQEVRCFKDKGFVRWPPHINLLYPFAPDEGDAFHAAATATAAACSSIAPFRVRLASMQVYASAMACSPVEDHLQAHHRSASTNMAPWLMRSDETLGPGILSPVC